MHCPATLLIAGAPEDDAGVVALLGRLSGEHVVSVVSAPGDLPGARVAARLDVPLEEEPALSEGESRELLGSIADLHRGETVLVLIPHGSSRGAQAPAGGAPVRRVELGEAY